MPTITTQDRTTTKHHTGGGKAPTVLDHTDVFVDGELVHTVTWVPALLRRLERMERTRDEYLAGVARRYLPAPRYYATASMNGAGSWDVYVGENVADDSRQRSFGLGPVVIAYTGRCLRPRVSTPATYRDAPEETQAPLELARQMADALNDGTATTDSVRRQAAVRCVGAAR